MAAKVITVALPALLPRSERLYQPVLSKAEIRSGCVDDVINQLNADNLARFHQFSRYRHIGIGWVNTGRRMIVGNNHLSAAIEHRSGKYFAGVN